MPEDLGRRISKLEKRMDSILKDQNKVNLKAFDNVMGNIQAQNKVNQKAYDHISKLEKRFAKLEKKR